MKDTEFLNVSAYVRVQEKRLLSGSAIERIVDASSTQEALRMLSQNSDYDFTTLRRVEDYEDLLKQELRRVYAMAYQQSAGFPAVVEILGCKYDYHNIKVALKAKYQGLTGPQPYFDSTPVPSDEIRRLAEKFDSKSSLPAHLLRGIQAGQAAYEDGQNPQAIDIALDREMFAYMLEQAGLVESGMITEYVRSAIDFYNVKTLMRVKSMQKGSAFLNECLVEGGNTDVSFFHANYGKNPAAMAPAFAFKSYGDKVKRGIESYEKTGNFSELERLFDNALINVIQDAKYISFGSEVLFAYLVSKENEIRQIRIIMACKCNGIRSEVLRERLRENYA